MDLKTVEIEGKTYAEVQDGKPVYVDDGKDVAFDAPGTVSAMAALRGEAKGHREAKQAAEAALKSFEGIDDPAAAIKALNTVKNLDDKKLVDAGEVDRIKSEAIKAVEEKYKPTVEKAEMLEGQLRKEMIGGQFARSQFISEKLAVPVQMVEKTFGDQFTIEDGKVIAKDANGNQIYSKSKPGEVAGFDEAMELIVEASPYRDHIMKGLNQNGSGAKPGNGGGGAKSMTHTEFNVLDAKTRASKMAEPGFQLTE